MGNTFVIIGFDKEEHNPPGVLDQLKGKSLINEPTRLHGRLVKIQMLIDGGGFGLW
ncbi:MAG TPA: hypothetical protein VNM22_21700 [Candidatus Limnocylindrales bacterium]|nr:hypothetical protein [Candidatus Limnocylindrales bacterium]